MYYNLKHVCGSLFHRSWVTLLISFLNDIPVLSEFCDGIEFILEARWDKVLPDRQRHKTLHLLTNQIYFLRMDKRVMM